MLNFDKIIRGRNPVYEFQSLIDFAMCKDRKLCYFANAILELNHLNEVV